MALFENGSYNFEPTTEQVIELDPTFDTNNFGQVKILSETETYVRNLLLILMGKPGFYPSIPDLGMDIGQYLYGFEDEIDTNEIKTKLAKQCSDFIPEIDSGDFDVFVEHYKNRPMLVFKLPVIHDDKTLSMALGIRVNEKGVFVYNFIENKTQLI